MIEKHNKNTAILARSLQVINMVLHGLRELFEAFNEVQHFIYDERKDCLIVQLQGTTAAIEGEKLWNWIVDQNINRLGEFESVDHVTGRSIFEPETVLTKSEFFDNVDSYLDVYDLTAYVRHTPQSISYEY